MIRTHARFRSAPLLLATALALASGGALAQEDISKVNGGVSAEAGQTYRDLSTVNGGIRLGTDARVGRHIESVSGGVFVDRGGRVGGNVSTVNGAIGLVGTEVAGDVKTVNGDVTIGAGSRVRGGLTIDKPSSNWFPVTINRRSPRVIIGPDAVVEGPLEFKREVTLYVHTSARTGAITGATAIPYDTPRAPQE